MLEWHLTAGARGEFDPSIDRPLSCSKLRSTLSELGGTGLSTSQPSKWKVLHLHILHPDIEDEARSPADDVTASRV